MERSLRLNQFTISTKVPEIAFILNHFVNQINKIEFLSKIARFKSSTEYKGGYCYWKCYDWSVQKRFVDDREERDVIRVENLEDCVEINKDKQVDNNCGNKYPWWFSDLFDRPISLETDTSLRLFQNYPQTSLLDSSVQTRIFFENLQRCQPFVCFQRSVSTVEK